MASLILLAVVIVSKSCISLSICGATTYPARVLNLVRKSALLMRSGRRYSYCAHVLWDEVSESSDLYKFAEDNSDTLTCIYVLVLRPVLLEVWNLWHLSGATTGVIGYFIHVIFSLPDLTFIVSRLCPLSRMRSFLY